MTRILGVQVLPPNANRDFYIGFQRPSPGALARGSNGRRGQPIHLPPRQCCRRSRGPTWPHDDRSMSIWGWSWFSCDEFHQHISIPWLYLLSPSSRGFQDCCLMLPHPTIDRYIHQKSNGSSLFKAHRDLFVWAPFLAGVSRWVFDLEGTNDPKQASK